MGGKTDSNLLRQSRLRHWDRERKKVKRRGGKEEEMVTFLKSQLQPQTLSLSEKVNTFSLSG